MRFRSWLVMLAVTMVPAVAFADDPSPKTDKPANKPTDKPADKPVDKPASKPAPTVERKEPALTASNLQLKDVVAKTDDLKTRIRDTRASLTTVSEEVFRTDTQGARTELVLQNDMSTAYRLQHLVLLLDNSKVADRMDENGSLADVKSVPMFSGLLTPGDHTFTLQLTFKGHGYGVFKYLEGYTFNVKSTHAVKATTIPVNLTVIAFEKGDQATALDQRPTVDWKEPSTKK